MPAVLRCPSTLWGTAAARRPASPSVIEGEDRGGREGGGEVQSTEADVWCYLRIRAKSTFHLGNWIGAPPAGGRPLSQNCKFDIKTDENKVECGRPNTYWTVMRH